MAENTPSAPPGRPSTNVNPNPAKPASVSGAAAPRESNLDVLLGVNLNLTLRFGQRVLPLREILDLNAGVIIELDREVEEPADLLLGDKVIARGQVVIVDGNYGLRITEVMDRGAGIPVA
jgi:flagellar motor switch protein FliN/FliY